jgi:hypothetical protein
MWIFLVEEGISFPLIDMTTTFVAELFLRNFLSQ